MQTSQLSSMASEDSPIKSLSTDLLGLLTNGRLFSDVTFEVEGQHVYAHRCVLAARSPFFRMIFCGDAQLHNDTQPRPGTPQIIPVGIVGFEVFKLLLQFLYGGKFSFSSPSVASACREKLCRHTHCTSAVEFGLETLNAAHFFGVDELTSITQVSAIPYYYYYYYLWPS
jgi:regulatory protein NPR1